MTQVFQTWCIVLGLGFIWPQVYRAVRHDTSHGISAFGLFHAVVGSALWMTYGLLKGDIAVWFSNISFLLAQSIIISVVYRHGRIPKPVLVRIIVALVILAVILTQAPMNPVGYVAIVVSGSSIVPQLVHVVKSENLHGISISSYLITIVNCMSWMFYGIYVDNLMISAQNFFSVPVIIFITWKAVRWRRANPDYIAVTTSVA